MKTNILDDENIEIYYVDDLANLPPELNKQATEDEFWTFNNFKNHDVPIALVAESCSPAKQDQC
ncbi:MAG: hypothetical protein HQK65_12945 [Desulfamplus sp.]|nr:hypothetical protein [Desulfamplus sp.]